VALSNKACFKASLGQLILVPFGGKAKYTLLGVNNTGPSGVGFFILGRSIVRKRYRKDEND